ncbi:hypothetical protein [Aquimarina muelleri]|uniref:Helix-turn-helix domain-containing protein n=1 Tax=Aquimarina muelleri TaxID=279356 RepID=A0A918JV19_9FLAO|nr:hypothetical protein [Aquimarina muelleri]MCX2764610.1 hypothetical protein [Aquimarina muelleri]GGX19264.1 hypothetical protein GCM10007384_20760 [Aquimarina muelleri]GGX33831.1 hypothetical protein GCM10007384_38180 [Aquimarina muelleri]
MKTYIKTEVELINPDADYYSLDEIRKLFNPPISYVTLWRWQKKGVLKLTPYVYGNKKFYHIEEVLQELKRHKKS